MRTRVLIVDDHQMMLEGLTYLLRSQSGFEISGRARNARDAHESLNASLPDIAILDIEMPGVDGLTLARQIQTEHPTVKTIILSSACDTKSVQSAIQAGVRGYVVKSNNSQSLFEAMTAVMSGKTYLCPDAATVMTNDYQKRLCADGAILSERECQILKRIAEGLSSKEIAAELNVSSKTIDTHRTNIMEKLRVQSVAELTKEAIRMGLTSI